MGRDCVKGRFRGGTRGPVSGRGLRELIPSARDSDKSYKHGIQVFLADSEAPDWRHRMGQWGGASSLIPFPGPGQPSLLPLHREGEATEVPLADPSAPGVLAPNGVEQG